MQKINLFFILINLFNLFFTGNQFLHSNISKGTKTKT